MRFLAGTVVLLIAEVSVAVELGAPFADGAVLQRGVKVPVWGTAASGETVEVSFAGQDRFVAKEPRAGMAVATDLGNFKDIHPNRKEAVAKRLAVHALRRDYGFDIAEDCSPVFRKAEYRDGAAHLSFDHVKSWYVYSPDRSVEPPFQLTGTNGVWHAAKLRGVAANGTVTNGVTLVVSSEAVPEPVNVRYLYENLTAGTLYNEVALPVGPFRDR